LRRVKKGASAVGKGFGKGASAVGKGFGKGASAVGRGAVALRERGAAVLSARRASMSAKNADIVARITNDYLTNMNNNKLPGASAILESYRKLHPLQMRSKNNQRIRNLRDAIRGYEARQKYEKKSESQKNIAARLRAFRYNNEFIEAYNKLGFLGKRSLKPDNKEIFDSRYRNIKLRAKAQAARKKVSLNAPERERLLQILLTKQPLSLMNRGRILSRRKNKRLQTDLQEYNAAKKNEATQRKSANRASKKKTANDTLFSISNYRNRLAHGMEFNNTKAAALLEAYNKAHSGRFGFMNNANARELRKQLANFKKNAATAKKGANNSAEQERLAKLAISLLSLPNSNPEFLAKYKELGMFGRRKFTPKNRQALTNKYTRITKAAANKAAANKAAANKAAANKAAANKAAANRNAAQRKFQINSLLSEILTHNQATIKSRVSSNLNTDFKGWRKVANKEKLRLLEAKLKPIPVFNNSVLRKAVNNHFSGVSRIYNKAVINAILKSNIPLSNNQRTQLQRMQQTRARQFAGALGRGAGGFFSGLFAPKPVRQSIPFKAGMKIPFGYVLKTGKEGLGLYKNNKALESQLEHRGYIPAPNPARRTGVSVGVGPGGYGYGYNRGGYGNGNRYGYGYNRGGPGPSAPAGGIVFAPKINVGAARIGAQTFGGTRVGGQQMGGSRVRTGNAGSTTLKTGNTGGVQVSNVGKVSNAGKANVGTRPANSGLAVSAPTSNGSRQLAATSEQLIRGAGGAEAIEKGVQALKAANGNVARAKAASRLPNNTFTNIYALGGPVAAKKAVATRRRSRSRSRAAGGRGAPGKKKRVVHKAKKQYIKLTPYQFRRLTDHIKKNNLRKVLIKEITH
jgi:hypothetical protein